MILRDLKLDIVLGNQNPIIDKFNEITNDLKVIKTDVYNDDDTEFIFYNEKNEWIFYQDLKNEDFWFHYDHYWSFFEDEFNLRCEEIQGLTKYLVEEILKLKVNTPLKGSRGIGIEVEEILKLKVNTQILCLLYPHSLVEEVLKSKL